MLYNTTHGYTLYYNKEVSTFMSTQTTGIEVVGALKARYDEVLTPKVLKFIEELEQSFGTRRMELLQYRRKRQEELNNGHLPEFLPETKHIRNGDWTIAPLPKDLQDRRVEITGPTDRKMVINALNSGAKVFMADCEDATSPTWENIVEGQINLRDAVNRTISYENQNGKRYVVKEETAVLFVRPRGLHLEEKHVLLNGKPISGSFFDFGMYFFHNVKNLLAGRTGPYFYLPKLESHLEARLWNDVFIFAQKRLGIAQGTIKATVLIETNMAAFEMN